MQARYLQRSLSLPIKVCGLASCPPNMYRVSLILSTKSVRYLQTSKPKSVRSYLDFNGLKSDSPDVFNGFSPTNSTTTTITANNSNMNNTNMNLVSSKSQLSKSNWSSYSLPTKGSMKKLLKKSRSIEEDSVNVSSTTSTATGAEPVGIIKKKRKLRPRKAFISLSPKAIVHLKLLLENPEPKLIRVSVRNRGCSGLTYDLNYITTPGKFDEVVEQDGVKVVIDSKALFSIVGSEMDWIDDKLSSRFVFKNPNSKGTCGCGESFHV